MKDEGLPFKIVTDNSFDTRKVIKTAIVTIRVRITAPRSDWYSSGAGAIIKRVISVVRAGNLPLHGTRQLVRIAMSLSLGESMILHPVTPAALQPNPIHMEYACFPQDEHFLK